MRLQKRHFEANLDYIYYKIEIKLDEYFCDQNR